MRKLLKITFIALSVALGTVSAGGASTRTLEMRFALSAEARSEFSKQFPVLGAGRIVVEANWSSAPVSRALGSLRLILIRPDGSIATSKNGSSILRLAHQASDQDLEKFADIRDARWTVKILNDADTNRSEVSGTIRITIPTASRALEDTQFTLLGAGNAQEIPFNVPAPGKLEIDTSWEPDVVSGPSAQVPLVISLIHPGESRTYARRQGVSPIKVEHQVTEQALDRGGRWVVRVQNDTQSKVAGRVKIVFTPSL